MALILTSRVPWRRRPSGLVEIDRSSPLAVGLEALIDVRGGAVLDLVSGARGAVYGSGTTFGVGTIGDYLRTTGAGGVTLSSPRLSSKASTHVAWMRIVGTPGSYGGVFSIASGDGSNQTLSLQRQATLSGLTVYKSSSDSGMTGGAWVDLQTDAPALLSVVSPDSTSSSVLLNGVAYFSGTGSTSPGAITSPRLVIGGERSANTTNTCPVEYCTGGVWSRALSSAEIWALYDPATRWSLYAPLVRRTYFDIGIGGGGGTTYNESIAVAADASLTHAHTLTVSEALAMAVDATMSPVGPLTAAAALGLDADATVAKVSALTAGSGIALGADAAVSPVAALSASPAMSLDADVSLAKSTAVAAVEAIALAADATLSKATTLVAAISLALAADASLSATDGTNSTYDEALALSADASLTPTGALIASLVADYAADAGLSAATSATIGEAIGLDLAGALEHVTQAAVAESIALGLTAVLQLAATASGDVTYTILRVAAETLRSARAQNDALRSAHVTGETLQ